MPEVAGAVKLTVQLAVQPAAVQVWLGALTVKLVRVKAVV